MNRSFLFALLVLTPGFARCEPVALTPDVQVQVEWIEVPHATLTKLMAEPALVADGTKLRIRLQELVKEEKASVFETAIVTAKVGKRASVESHREWLYPVDAELIGIPNQVASPMGASRVKPKVSPLLSLVSHTPPSFATRNVGSVMDIEATLKEGGKLIELRCGAEQTRVAGTRDLGKRKTVVGEALARRVPEFVAMRLSIIVTMLDGAYAMAGVTKRSDAPDQRIIVMVRCDVLDSEALRSTKD